jgi:hypothetical protein
MGIFSRKSTGEKPRYRFRDRVERGEFRGSSVVELKMPDSVLVIGESGFRECRSLTNAVLSNSLCEIGPFAFRDCDMLENVLMPGEMRYPDGTNGMLGIGCFEGCSLLHEIIIPEGVAVIGANAFHNCAALESVTLPRTLRAIHSGAFSGCARLKTLHMASMPEMIALDAFQDTPQQETMAAARKPVLTILHRSSFAVPQMYQFSTAQRLIGVEQTEGDMSIVIDAIEESRICFRVAQYKYAGGSHVVTAGEPTQLFSEEYDCGGRTGTQKEEIFALYR